MRKKYVSVLIAILLVATLLLPMQPANSAAPSSDDVAGEVSWRVETIIPLDEIPASTAGAAPADLLRAAVQARLTNTAVSIDLSPAEAASGAAALKLSLSGRNGLGQLRQVIYDDLADQLRFPSSPADLRLETSLSANQVVEIVLESNFSTGYRWQLDESQRSGLRQVQEGILAQSGLSDGEVQKQTLSLAAGTAVRDSIQLVYRRPWETAQAQTVVTLQLAELPPVLDLSSPQPEEAESQAQPAFTQIGPQQAAAPELLPTAFDWRTTGKVTSVRDQGNCGSCWAFGAVGVMESALLIAGEGSPAILDLSEQYLVSCNTYGYNCEIGGFWDTHNHHYTRSGKLSNPPGAVLESELPYTASDGTCARVYTHPYQLTGWSFINPSYPPVVPGAVLIKQAIYDHGPVGVSVCVGSAFQNYDNGIFSTDESSNCQYSNHAVILVGWNDNNGNGYWILKNSWGPGWGEAGYMRIRWGTSRIGIFANYVTYTNVSNPVPAITRINPLLAFKGGAGFTLSVFGSGFINSSKVRWNGADRTTTFVNAGQLNASISASDIATLGSASVTVYTPPPGGGTSSAAVLYIIDPATLTRKMRLPAIYK